MRGTERAAMLVLMLSVQEVVVEVIYTGWSGYTNKGTNNEEGLRGQQARGDTVLFSTG